MNGSSARFLPSGQLCVCWILAFGVAIIWHNAHLNAQLESPPVQHLLFHAAAKDTGSATAVAGADDEDEYRDGANWLEKPEPILKDLLLEQGATWRPCGVEGDICPCRSTVVRYGVSAPAPSWTVIEAGTGSQHTRCDAATLGGDGGDDFANGQESTKRCDCLTRIDERMPVRAVLPAIRATTTKSPCPDGRPLDFCGVCPSSPDDDRAEVCQELPYNYSLVSVSRCRLLWSCDKDVSRRAADGAKPHEVLQAQDLHDMATEELCKIPPFAQQLEVYLDCGFYEQWARLTEHGTEWLEEAYVTYVGGSSKYAGQITNLLRSVHMASKRPIVLMVIGHEFICPEGWRDFKQLIVYRMRPLGLDLSFNFNKVRAIIGARVLTGIELDSDQLLVYSMDVVFPATRREVTATYPFPILPVHFASLDAKPGEPYATYHYKNWDQPHGMRWCHAHPSWTYWALPFFTNIVLINFAAYAVQKDRMADWQAVRPFDLQGKAKTGIDLRDALRLGASNFRVGKQAIWEKWMNRDETSMNVYLWKAGAEKAWCKFDLEPCLFFKGRDGHPKKLYYDASWYPDGLPVLFYSMHNTKGVSGTAKVLELMQWCSSPEVQAWTNCSSAPTSWRQCQTTRFVCDMFSEKKEAEGLGFDFAALKSKASYICCCMRPRFTTPIFWQGKWYKQGATLPEYSSEGTKRRCLVP